MVAARNGRGLGSHQHSVWADARRADRLFARPIFLLVGVSLSLCWVRLSTRSLAASTIVHASYNFLLFSLMFLETGGFKNLDKM